MEIREAGKEDIPEIIEVLKASLGESKLPKSVNVWNFKHLENPFGDSLVLLAIEEGKIIGVRAYMKWQWQKNKRTIKAFRAVDTATHPDHRRKGIFKKLTLKANEIAKSEGGEIVFNTPNTQSKPGYLKMGWKAVSKLSIIFIPVIFFKWKKNYNTLLYNTERLITDEHLEELLRLYNENQTESGKIFTPKTIGYLNWRYEKNPLQSYKVIAKENFYLAAYVKHHKYLKELRITEAIYIDKTAIKEIKIKTLELAREFGAHFISIANTEENHFGLLCLKGSFGPLLTLKSLDSIPDEGINFLELKNWKYSIGDLELF